MVLLVALLVIFVLGVCGVGMGPLSPTNTSVSAFVASASDGVAAVSSAMADVPVFSYVAAVAAISAHLIISLSCLTDVPLVDIAPAFMLSALNLPVPYLY